MHASRWIFGCLVLMLVSSPSMARGGFHPADMFQDHMVLQRDMAVPVWGEAAPGATVRLTLGEIRAETGANEFGSWLFMLDPMPAGGPLTMTIGDGTTTKTFQDVLVGEVWLCGGQSNMDFSVQGAINEWPKGSELLDQPRIRMLRSPYTAAQFPQRRQPGQWEVCTPETGAGTSAVGFFFGLKLLQELDVPVGLIVCSRGGTPIEAYSSAEIQGIHPMLRPHVDRWIDTEQNWSAIWGGFYFDAQRWPAVAEKAKAEGQKVPDAPSAPTAADSSVMQPGSLFNGQIAPLAPYAVRGAIWYQGEADAGNAWQYRVAFPSMIHAWRALWGQPRFHFYFVQLANFGVTDGRNTWPELREAQAMTLEMPETAMAVAIDIGDSKDIHPKNKQDVGLRLALPALHHIYGKQDVVWSGPAFDSMTVKGGKATLSFSHAEGLKTRDGGPVSGFAIAGADRQFHPAQAAIKGGKVIVSAAAVAAPEAVRYAWADDPQCNVYNGAGLPMVPFRTDRWPMVTAGGR